MQPSHYCGGHRQLLAALFVPVLLNFAGCDKNRTSSQSQTTASPAKDPASGPAKFDACSLITKEEIETVQGSAITETKNTGTSNKGMMASQCYYAAADPSRSVSLVVIQSDPNSPSNRSGKDVWKESFGRYSGEENDGAGQKDIKSGRREEKERKAPPVKIGGLGDAAYWAPGKMGGTLYVLKKDAFIRISLGGTDTEQTKINKSRTLAEKALQRL
jgi:hypothetical protein